MSFFKKEGLIGTRSWNAFPKDRVDEIFEAAAAGHEELKTIEKPWLCLSVDPDWCVIQQKLVAEVGWTPVVRMDYQRYRRIRLQQEIKSAGYIDASSSIQTH